MSIEYIRKTYKVPAKIGGRIKLTYENPAKFGMIIGVYHNHLTVLMDNSDKDDRILNCHPTWNIEYLN